MPIIDVEFRVIEPEPRYVEVLVEVVRDEVIDLGFSYAVVRRRFYVPVLVEV